MAKVELRLRTNQGEQENGYPIYYYIRYQGKPKFKHTGYFAAKKHWNFDKQQLRSSHQKGKKLVNYLNDECLTLQMQLTKAENDGLSYSSALSKPDALPAFTQHFENRIKELQQAGDLGNAHLYQVHFNWLKNFGGAQLTFKQLDYQLLINMRSFMDGQNLSYNTMRQRFATYKAVFNDAKRRWPHEITGNPFAGLLKGRKPAYKEQDHQPIANIKRLVQFEAKTKTQSQAVDMWLLAFALRGAGLIDMLYFEPAKIKDGYFPLKRLKMPKREVWVKVKITPFAQRIIERHHKTGQRYLFNFCTLPRNDKTLLPGQRQPEGTRQYQNARNRIDKCLKRISGEPAGQRGKHFLNLKPALSMKQARHSWIIAARDLGTPKEIIEQAVGHRGQSVMDRHYYGRFAQSIIDEVNEKVLSLIL